ncbi:MAG: MaoC family dehydratase N-terminal domain-containing protein [Desulfobacterales bacterium]|nr:MaoC family dehydratase N-terminal domain-containing protein [Desulfobacterales bacterium]
MKLNSQLAGTRLKNYQTEVSQRQTVNFAAGLNDNNPIYFDDIRAQGVAAPPTFPVSITWPVLSQLGDFILLDEFPKEVLFTQVHYTEHLVIHRLVRPGDHISLDGKIVSITPHRAGTHAIIRLDAKDGSSNPVFTEYIGAMLRGVDCDGEMTVDPLPQIPENDPAVPTAWTCLLEIDPLTPYIYDACADIEFPIHTSPKFARDVGLPGILLQGTATLGLAVRELVNNQADGNPEAVKEIACTFTGMVEPGTDIEICCLETRQKKEFTHIFFEVINASNKKAIRNGYMKIQKESV